MRIRDAFIASAPQGRRQALSDAPDLDATLSKMIAEAAASWPGVTLGEKAFVEYVAARLDEDADPIDALTRANTSDLFIACACASRAPGAFEAFESAFAKVIDGVLRKVPDLSSSSADIAQIVREKLLVASPPKIGEYAGRSPLRTWLRVVASRVAIDLVRGPQAQTTTEDALTSVPSPVNDPELNVIKERHAREFTQAFRDAAAELSAAERILLKQHYGDGLTLDQLALQNSVHRVTLARRLAGAREKLAAGTRRLLLTRFQIGAKELESLMVLVRSRFDVSVRTLLDTPD